MLPKKILICSLGSIGRYYLRLIKTNWPNIEVAVHRSGFGPDCKELQDADVVFYSKDEAVKWKPCACIISSPASLHLEQALYFASYDIPLLIEKPLGTGLENQNKWNDLIRFNKRLPIFVGYILRSHPCAKYLKQQLNDNNIGEIVDADFYCGSWLPNWRSEQDYRNSVSSKKELGGGVLLEVSHEIDLAIWLLGNIKVISSCIKESNLLNIDVEDRALILGSNDKDSLITIRLNFCSRPDRRLTTIRGTNGDLVWDILNGKLKSNFCDKENEIYEYSPKKDAIFKNQLEDFFQAIKGSKCSLCSLEEGLSALKLITICQRASK